MIDKLSKPTPLTQEEAAKAKSIDNFKGKPPKKVWVQRLPYILGGLGLLAILIWAFRPVPIAVDVAEVKQDDVRVTVDEEGETRIRKRYLVSAPVEGRLRRIDLDEGDLVTKGQIVAQIDPLSLESEIQEARARLRQWQAEKKGVETQRPKQEAIAQAEARISSVLAQQREAEARVARIRADLAQAKRDRDRNQSVRWQNHNRV